MAEDEGVGFLWFRWREELDVAVDFVGEERELEHHLDDEVYWLRACEGVWVVFQDVVGAKDALKAAALDVELVVAEAVAEFVGLEVPVGDGAVAEVFTQEDVQCADDVPHHAVANNDHFFEAGEDRTDFFSGVPAHVAAERDER